MKHVFMLSLSLLTTSLVYGGFLGDVGRAVGGAVERTGEVVGEAVDRTGEAAGTLVRGTGETLEDTGRAFVDGPPEGQYQRGTRPYRRYVEE